MSFNIVAARQAAAASKTTSRPLIARSQARCFSSTPSTSASGPSGAEGKPQGSDQRGKTTTYILPITAVALVAFALTVRLTSKDSKQNAVNVGIGTEGASKLKGSKAKSIADDKANARVDNNIGK